MLIDKTSDLIRFKLGAAITSTALTFTADYNNYTATAVSLNTNNGTSNNTTEVTIVPSPGASQQNQLRYCSIYNSDTASATVKIIAYDGTAATSYQVFQAVLAVGDLLQYQLEKGWEVIDTNGNKKSYAQESFMPSINGSVGFRPGLTSGTLALTGRTWYTQFLGRAEKAYTTMNIMYNVTTPVTATVAQLAIYSSRFYSNDGVSGSLDSRAGFVSITGSTGIGATGIKRTTIPLTGGINPGDRLYAVFNHIAATSPSLTSLNYRDDTGSLMAASIATGGVGNYWPSLIDKGVQITSTSGATGIWLNWQAS